MKKFLIYVFGFLLIYYPGLIPNINPYIFPLCMLLLLMLIELPSKSISVIKNVKNKEIFLFILGIIASIAYYAIIYSLNNNNITLMDMRIVQGSSVIIYLFLVLYLLEFLKKMGNNYKDNMEFLFIIGSIQGIICILMLLIPSFKEFANYLMYSSGKFEKGAYIFTTRVYGISNTYTYGLPIYHGLLSGLCFYISAVKEKKFFKYLPFIFIVAFLNGRTGILIAVLSIILSSIYLIIKKGMFTTVLSYLFKFSILFSFVILMVKLFLPNIFKFVSILWVEINAFIVSGELSGTTQYLARDNFFIPDGFGLLFGEGFRPYSDMNSIYKTDIGFVNDLFMGGILYISLLYGSFIKLLMSKKLLKKDSFLIFIVIISTLIANWKGEIFKNSTFIIGFLFIALNYIVNNFEEGSG